ncbi:aldehyde dehydrogenase [Tropicimonas sp. IMCC6043]|uniref:aldehyde dehydrogenase family protein n=1 Tax=Tropicimonas sp. IMCC6043 TaxID=2510645 RepID=UPI00101BF60D|nr:aldehyde dehydrogenase family protein [Tropicimonas sp. IMCC6043]RYH11335.1 aldehyde dehydrogenase [Tropicimonas sp. IMCC6043]
MSHTVSTPILDLLATILSGDAPTLPSIYTAAGGTPAAGGETFDSHDPSTGRLIARLARGRAEDAERAVASATAALPSWRDMVPQDRGQMLMRLAEVLEAHSDLLARLETMDMGKPLSAARGDMRGCVGGLRYNAGWADKLQGITVPLGPDFVDYAELEPLGVTVHITPWNYPLGMAMRSAAPALAAGCTVILKPAEQSSLTTLAFAELCRVAGLPAGVVTCVTGFGAEAGAALTDHPGIDGITFTGSVATGRRIGEAAGRNLKPVVLELGGKNPILIFDDADIDAAVEVVLDGAFDNCGQVCSSVSRVVLQRGIHDAFLDRLVDAAKGVTVAPGMEDAMIGPLVSAEQHAKVMSHIESARTNGARLLLGGGRPAGLEDGWFVAPTIFADVDPASAIASEETFGPVITAFAFDTEEEALALANRLTYGLVAGVFTKDIDRALRLSRSIRAGSVWINGWFIGGLQAPTGGTRDSGVGRERGEAGIMNYVALKNIGIRIRR